MPKIEQDELEMQAEELVKAGLAEAFPPVSTSKCAYVHFWSQKRIRTPIAWLYNIEN